MTVQELIKNYHKHNPGGHYFDKETLKYFGEKISTMTVATEPVVIKDYSNVEHRCWVLSSIQHPPYGGPTIYKSYFDVVNFKEVFKDD